MNDAPTVISLFSGVGGLDRGLQLAGWRHLYLCEKDEGRRRILRRHFPGVVIRADVREVEKGRGGRQLAGVVGGDGHRADAGRGWSRPEDGDGRPVLLCGGFPCTDVSAAGQRRGLAGEESGLFFEFARVADAVRPRWILVENVPGLLTSHGGRDFGTVLESLADIGYGLAWRILDSRYFGVPQRRRRVFIVGAEAGGDPRAAAERAGLVLGVGTRCSWHSPEVDEEREDVAAVAQDGAGSDLARTLGSLTGGYRTTDLDGVGAYVTMVDRARRLTPVECERLQGLPDDWTKGVSDTRRYDAIGDAVTTTVARWIGTRIREREEADG